MYIVITKRRRLSYGLHAFLGYVVPTFILSRGIFNDATDVATPPRYFVKVGRVQSDSRIAL